MINEMESLTLFAEMFPAKVTFMWGISEVQSINNNSVKACIMASNLKRK